MLHHPNPALTAEEQELIDKLPEECLRRAVARGALSIDSITAGLSPQAAAAVQSIITGERVPETFQPRASFDIPDTLKEEMLAQTSSRLAAYPQLKRLLNERVVEWIDIEAAAQAVDRALGRYLTGTRYAAP